MRLLGKALSTLYNMFIAWTILDSFINYATHCETTQSSSKTPPSPLLVYDRIEPVIDAFYQAMQQLVSTEEEP
jgi:hypothetical protein